MAQQQAVGIDSVDRFASNPASAEAAAPFRAWAVDPATFSTHKISALRHNFHLHPLMQLPRLAELAKALYPTKQCRFIMPGSTQASSFQHAEQSYDGRDIDEVFRRIEEQGSWVALYNVETDPTYRGFLNEVTQSVRNLVDAEQPGMFNVGGFIFISTAPSVTPFHIDRENNFWLQVSGQKTISVWDHTDRQSVTGPAVEDFIVFGTLNKVKLTDSVEARGHKFDVGPGDGVYFPSTSPHMTRCDVEKARPGQPVSISIGVVFYTEETRRQAYVHAINRVLRKVGVSPQVPGQSPLSDALKYPLGRAAVWAMTRRGYKPRVGF